LWLSGSGFRLFQPPCGTCTLMALFTVVLVAPSSQVLPWTLHRVAVILQRRFDIF